MIKEGSIVKYKDELPDEIGARYLVLRVDSPRAMIEYIPVNWINIPVQTIVNLSDIEEVITE